MGHEVTGFQSGTVSQIDQATRLRLYEPAIIWLYEDFITSGILHKEGRILVTNATLKVN